MTSPSRTRPAAIGLALFGAEGAIDGVTHDYPYSTVIHEMENTGGAPGSPSDCAPRRLG